MKLSYFRSSFVVAAVGLILAYIIGGGLSAVLIAALLAILELSLSVDNAVVNASLLKTMDPTWQKRFLTWGMFIAVFGMRLVFPLLIVAGATHANPWAALQLALFHPHDYAKVMFSVHKEVAAFGGAFLALVALNYFIDYEKKLHWITLLEKPLVEMGKLEAVEVGIVLFYFTVSSHFLPSYERLSYLSAGILGILVFILVDGVETLFKVPTKTAGAAATAGLGLFIYLEILDASFSFDGVIGAFAITHNLLIISIGLGIGAMFVRSLTFLMVREGTLDTYRYLEHGAFYAIAALAIIMLVDPFIHFPEAATGLIGAVLIALSVFSSVRATVTSK